MLAPDGGVHVTEAPQLSVTVGALLATAPPALHSSVWSAGHTIAGGVVSTTVTVAEHEEVRPSTSMQVSVTGVVPSAYGAPRLCVQPARSLSGSSEPKSIEALP